MAMWQGAAAGPPVAASRRRSPILPIVTTLAGALLVIGTLLPWVKGTLTINLPFLGSRTITHTVTGSSVRQGSVLLACGFVILGSGLMMVLFNRSRAMRMAMGVLVIAALGVIVSVFLGLLSQKDQVDALRTSIQKISNGGGPLGQFLQGLKNQLNPSVHVATGTGIYLVAVGLLGGAVGGIAGLVSGALPGRWQPAVAASSYAAPAASSPPAAYGQPVVQPSDWFTPAPAAPTAPAAPAAPAAPPMPGGGSHAPTVIGETPGAGPLQPPPPRRHEDPPRDQRGQDGGSETLR